MKGSTWFCFYTVFTLAAIYRIEIGGFSPLQLVLAGTVMELASFVFEVPTGVVADVYSRRLSMVLGHAVMGLGFLVEGAWPWVTTILLAQCIFGLGYTLISGAEDAWLADEIGEDQFAKVVLRGTQAEQVGSFLGIVASVVLASFDLRWPFLVAGLGLWLQALLLWRVMPEDGFRPNRSPSSSSSGGTGFDAALRRGWSQLWHTFRSGLSFTRQRPLLLTLMMVAVCYGLASEGLDRLWEAHLLEHFSFPSLGGMSNLVWIGLISATILLCTLIASEGVQRYLHRPSASAGDATDASASPRRLLLLLTGQSVLVVVGLLIFALSDHFWLAVLTFIVVNILRRLARPIFLALINRGLDSSVRATVLSTVNQMDSIGQFSGGPMVGLIGNRWGLRVALVVVAALLTPVWGFYRRAWKQVTDSTSK